MGKVMRVYLCGQEWIDSREEMYLDLPATPWELVDALEKLNLNAESDLYVQAEEYYDFDYIQGFIPESTTLSQLNELCAKLDSLREMDRIGFRGLLQSSAYYDRFNLGVDRLLDIANAMDHYHIASDISNDRQLGRFLCFNGFVDDVLDLPEKIYEMLDFEKIGREYRIAEHGAFVENCFVAPDHEIPHQKRHYGISPPEYVVMMDLVSKEAPTKHFPLALPADYSEMDHALEQLGAESWDEVTCVCTDCQIPQIRNGISNVSNIALANRFAAMLDRLPVEEISKLKAVLEVTQCEDLTTASLIAQELDHYMLFEDIRDPETYARSTLSYLLSENDKIPILKHINLYAYGAELLQQDESLISSYGLIERTDGQPILAPQSSTPQMTMQ